jgi:hypothetical protein
LALQSVEHFEDGVVQLRYRVQVESNGLTFSSNSSG